MTTIVTRAEKGSPLSFVEVDDNFINLNTAKVEGPGVSVDGEIVLFDSTSGALLKRANITGLIKAASGVAAAAVAGTDYLSPPSGTSLLKANSGGALANAVAGTDYIAPGGALGTPSSVTLTNATDLPISTGVSGLGTGIAAALAINVGSSGAPIVNGGALGTPSSATLTNATGLPISTGVSGLGTGVATFLTTPSSANLATAVTDETGSGSLVFGTSPALNNPTVTNYVESVVTIGTVTTTNTIALTNGTVQTATLTASTACTFTMPTATAGKSFILLLKQAATTGNGTATFTSVKWGTAGAPTITATAGKMDILTFVADGTNWYGSIAQGYTP